MPRQPHVPADVDADAQAKEAALRAFREELSGIVLDLATVLTSASPERFRQVSVEAADRIQHSVATLDVADLEHQLRTGRPLLPDRELP